MPTTPRTPLVTSAEWKGHWHGYAWTGSGTIYFAEFMRRPASLDAPHTRRFLNDPHTRAFIDCRVPPVMTGHWLLKKRLTTPDRTWTDAASAVAWLRERYEAHPPASPTIALDVRTHYATDALPRGVDVTWGYWTRGQDMASFSVVACVNLHHPTIPCPLKPTASA